MQLAAPYIGLSAAESASLNDLLPSDPHAAPIADRKAPGSFGSMFIARLAAMCDVRAAYASITGALHALWKKRSLKLMLLGRGSLYILNFGIVLAVALGTFAATTLTLCGNRVC